MSEHLRAQWRAAASGYHDITRSVAHLIREPIAKVNWRGGGLGSEHVVVFVDEQGLNIAELVVKQVEVGRAEVVSLGTAPQHRRQGMAALLFEAMDEYSGNGNWVFVHNSMSDDARAMYPALKAKRPDKHTLLSVEDDPTAEGLVARKAVKDGSIRLFRGIRLGWVDHLNWPGSSLLDAFEKHVRDDVGVHWTTDEFVAFDFAAGVAPAGHYNARARAKDFPDLYSMGVVVTAEVPFSAIEGEVSGMFAAEKEHTLKRGARVKIDGIWGVWYIPEDDEVSNSIMEHRVNLTVTASKTAAPSRLYHGTDVVLRSGEVLEPGGRVNYQEHLYGGAAGKVFMAEDPEMAFFYAVMGAISQGNFDRDPHVYEVDAPEASYNQPGEWVAPTATVGREVTAQAKAALKANWDTWKTLIGNLVPPGPGLNMTLYEFERALR